MQLAWVLAFIVGLLVTTGEGIRFEERSKAPTYADPDKFGYRYCASWQLADGTPIYSGCDPFSFNRCGETLKYDYRCCSGFEFYHQSLGGSSSKPCARLIPQFNDCPSVVESLGFKKFASYLRQMPELDTGSAYTIFVPMPADGGDLEATYGRNNREVGYHVVRGRFYADDLRSGAKLQSIYDKEELEIFRSPCGSVNIECTELSQADIECKSGLIHIIRKPLVPRKGLGNLDKSSVMTLLRSNPETKDFGNDLPLQLQRALDNVQSGRMYTVTAPVADSWSRAKSGKNSEQIQQMAASHVTDMLKCSSEIFQSTQTFTDMTGERFNIQCQTVNKNEVRSIIDACGRAHKFVAGKSDMTAANGVIHLLDSPRIPSTVLTLKDFMNDPECAKYQRIDKFIDVLKECDLFMEDPEQYIIIAPENAAFDWWRQYFQFQEEYKRFQTDPEYRCRVARYHIVKHTGKLFNLTTFSGHTDGHRTNNRKNYLYETTYFVKDKMGSKLYYHFSPVNNFEELPLQGLSIYRTARINVIPEVNITDVVERPDLEHSKNLMLMADMDEKYFKKNAPKNLYLVPTDGGWIDPRSKAMGKNLTSPELARYQSSPDLASSFAILHHVPLYLWGGDIGYFEKNSVHRFMSSAGIELIFWMNDKGEMRIGYDGLPENEWPKVKEFNLHARDGIVWTLDGFLKCPITLCPFQLEDTDTYTFFTAACLTTDLPGEVNVKENFRVKPMEIANRHPNLCMVVKQGEVTTTKDVYMEEDNPGRVH